MCLLKCSLPRLWRVGTSMSIEIAVKRLGFDAQPFHFYVMILGFLAMADQMV